MSRHSSGLRGVAAVPSTDPTPAEIRGLCLEIQEDWTDDERDKRAHGRGLDALIKAHEVANQWHRERGVEPEVDQ